MEERDIDISGNTPRLLTEQLVRDADLIITMGCSIEEACPAPILKRSIDWALDDPKGKGIEEVRRIRDQIEKNVAALLRNLRGSTGVARVVQDQRKPSSES
jgi:protein-tyrosine-phosphatase